VQSVLDPIPTVALAEAFRFAFSRGVTVARMATNLGLVLGSALLVFAVVAWRIRRSAL
jgi:hypothetical protein